MTENRTEQDRQVLVEAQKNGIGATLGAYVKLSGPGWLQSAITLGGGSLASSLYLGILAGYTLMWLQPIAMILGIIMLSAIGYVTMSTGERPFKAINEHVNPVLGWGWAFAVAAANIVWCLPQFSLASSVINQNLIPAFSPVSAEASQDPGDAKAKANDDENEEGDKKDSEKKKSDKVDSEKNDATKNDVTTKSESEKTDEASVGNAADKAEAKKGKGNKEDTESDDDGNGEFDIGAWLATGDNQANLIIVSIILILATVVTWSYDSGGRGIKIYETVLKCMVAVIVVSFFGVVVVLSMSKDGLPWNDIFNGLVPNMDQFTKPAATFLPLLNAIADENARAYWADLIVTQQKDVMISAAATAVGINMTFLFPYSLLRKGWGPEFRGLAIFDLSTGMFIPYILATGCVVIASSAQFHAKYEGFTIENAAAVSADAALQGRYTKMIDARKSKESLGQVSEEEVIVAAALVKRDSRHLSSALGPLTGNFVANIVFGIGVLAMTVSTISLLMMISGFVFAEILEYPAGGKVHKVGTLVAGVAGATGPFIWGDAAAYLAVPTSVFGFVLLPFAYVTFVLLMNQGAFLGSHQPRGFKRLLWNLMMLTAATVATVGSVYMIWQKAGVTGMVAVGGFVLLALMVQINRSNVAKASA